MDLETTIAQLRERLNANPDGADAAEAAATLGNIFYDEEDPPHAIMYYLIALEIDPDQPGTRTDMGAMLWQTGNVALAERAFRRVLAEHPDFGNAYINLGLLLEHGMGDTAQAREIWQTLVDRYPDDPSAEEARRLLTTQ